MRSLYMKKRIISFITLILAILLLNFSFISCNTNVTNTTETDGDIITENTTGSTESSAVSEYTTEAITEIENENETETENNSSDMKIEGEYARLIENANSLKNGVQAYFTDSSRDYFALENAGMKFSYSLRSNNKQLVSRLTNSEGVPYITDTMDVFVKMRDGNTYFASGSTVDATANLYRVGMYYYEARFEEQNFLNSPDLVDGDPLDGWSINTNASHNIENTQDNVFQITDSNDPYIVISNASFSANTYNVLKIKIRSISGTKGSGVLFIKAGTSTNFTSDQAISFNFTTDGEYHDVYIPLYNMKGYSGTVTSIRLDIDGNAGSSFEIASITPAKFGIERGTPLNLSLCRSFYVYTDKMHHSIQIASTEQTKGVEEVGMLTYIDADTVAKLLIKDEKGTHDSLEGVNWKTVEYVGFDIIEAGIFGYILPVHEYAGNIKVSIADGQYIIEQTRVPENNVIRPSQEGTNNGNDFMMAQRIYTDEAHSFDTFIKEAEIERNPINKFISVSSTEFTKSSLSGYDPIRGIYVIDIDGPGGFNGPYYLYQNRHFTTSITIKNCPDDRNIYIMALADSGALECSAVLSKGNFLLPIPVSVCKNFSEKSGERNLYNIDDEDYSEAFFPISLNEKDRYTFSIVNIYQNWGKYPIKQISSIQFKAPYYHLSTGVTESNCIVPWYTTKTDNSLNTLPDFRAMSAPLWEGQPQRNSGGSHSWLEYTDSEGNYSATENVANYIDSYGPTYADITMHFISDDGRIKATFTHSEMPQTDENRTYYEIKYEVLEDINISDFKNDFKFYSVTDNEPASTADYRKIGYLNSNNECTVTDSNLTPDTKIEYILGNECPYFSMFDMPYDASPDGYTNVAFIIYNSEIIIGGEKSEASFVIINKYNAIDLSLDLGETTLKAGDSFTINAILMPWGSHESDYTDVDKNVRDVRENSALNPLTVFSEIDEVIESVYIPKIKSTDGYTATFTLKGGHNNVSVRAYGFKKLTIPKLYELIDGNWETVELSSCTTPDTSGYYNHYDGYVIHYDGDGTYSYSFVTEMINGAERTFKLDLSAEPYPLPASGKNESPNYLDTYYDANEIKNIIDSSGIFAPKFSNVVLSEDGSYISLYANNLLESFFMVKPADDEITGQYLVVKYRVPTTNTTKFSNFEFYLSSTNTDPKSGENIKYETIKHDGEWHILVMDASSFNHKSFKPDDEGKYNARYIRFDVFNTPNLLENNYIDIGFFGTCDTLEEICDITKNEFDKIDLSTGKGNFELITKTCKLDIKTYIVPESGYEKSSLPYYSVIDSFYSEKLNATGNSVEGIVLKTDFPTTVPTSIIMGGWAIIEGGVSHFVWSADGGLTWNTIDAALTNVGDNYINHAQTKMSTSLGREFKFSNTESTKENGGFQTPKMTLDLSEYAGQTVNLIFAAVPATEENTLCLLLCIEDLTISNE